MLLRWGLGAGWGGLRLGSIEGEKLFLLFQELIATRLEPVNSLRGKLNSQNNFMNQLKGYFVQT